MLVWLTVATLFLPVGSRWALHWAHHVNTAVVSSQKVLKQTEKSKASITYHNKHNWPQIKWNTWKITIFLAQFVMPLLLQVWSVLVSFWAPATTFLDAVKILQNLMRCLYSSGFLSQQFEKIEPHLWESKGQENGVLSCDSMFWAYVGGRLCFWKDMVRKKD